MNEFVTSSTEPSYLTSLALTAPPFSPTDSVTFFLAEQTEQRLNLLLHLVRASDKVALLFAPKGVGKSALLSQLQNNMADDVRICFINASPSIETKTLIVHCLREFGVDDNEIRLSENHLELLQQRCLSLQHLNIKPLLLIDDAEQLSEDTLVLILSWLNWQSNDHFLLQAVLTADHAMPELNTIHGRIQRVDLPALPEAELAAYLYHRLESVGYKGELPFKTNVLSYIYRKSSGNPAQINQLAHQELLGIKPTSDNTAKIRMWLKWIGVGLVVALIALALLFQDKINTLFLPTEKQLDLEPLSELIPEPEITAVIADSDSQSSEIQTNTQVEDLVDLARTNIDENPEVKLHKEDDQGRKELEALLAELAISEQKETKIEPASKPTVQAIQNRVKEVVTPLEPKDNTRSYNREEWILHQDKNNYTFQLMGSWDEKNVVEYIKKYKLKGDVAIFKSKRNGQVWYALIYGVYETKEKAQQATTSWPVTLKKLPKWLRSFDSVQQQIQK